MKIIINLAIVFTIAATSFSLAASTNNSTQHKPPDIYTLLKEIANYPPVTYREVTTVVFDYVEGRHTTVVDTQCSINYDGDIAMVVKLSDRKKIINSFIQALSLSSRDRHLRKFEGIAEELCSNRTVLFPIPRSIYLQRRLTRNDKKMLMSFFDEQVNKLFYIPMINALKDFEAVEAVDVLARFITGNKTKTECDREAVLSAIEVLGAIGGPESTAALKAIAADNSKDYIRLPVDIHGHARGT